MNWLLDLWKDASVLDPLYHDTSIHGIQLAQIVYIIPHGEGTKRTIHKVRLEDTTLVRTMSWLQFNFVNFKTKQDGERP